MRRNVDVLQQIPKESIVNKFRTNGLIAALILVGVSVSSRADTINQVLLNLAADAPSNLYQEATFDFNDEDRSVIFDTGPGSVADGVFGEGDIIRGTFVIESISVGTKQADLGIGGNNAMFGRYSIVIDSIFTDGFGTTQVKFKADSTAGFTDSTALFQFYEAAVNPIDNDDADAGFSDILPGTNATLWGEAGLAGGGVYQFAPNLAGLAALDNNADLDADSLNALEWAGEGRTGFDVNDLLKVGAGESIAFASAINLNWVTKPLTGIGDTDVIESIGTFGAGHEIDGTSGTSILGDADIDFLASKAAFATKLTIIPTPAAVLPGLALFGMLGLRRDRRKA